MLTWSDTINYTKTDV